jgi:hypothetical protein
MDLATVCAIFFSQTYLVTLVDTYMPLFSPACHVFLVGSKFLQFCEKNFGTIIIIAILSGEAPFTHQHPRGNEISPKILKQNPDFFCPQGKNLVLTESIIESACLGPAWPSKLDWK